MTDRRLADLIDNALDAELELDDAREVEPYYEAVLDALLGSPCLRAEAVEVYIRDISSIHRFSPALMAYCMHTLRCPEVRQAVMRLLKPQDNENWRRLAPNFRTVLHAYEDSWSGREFYRRYSGP